MTHTVSIVTTTVMHPVYTYPSIIEQDSISWYVQFTMKMEVTNVIYDNDRLITVLVVAMPNGDSPEVEVLVADKVSVIHDSPPVVMTYGTIPPTGMLRSLWVKQV